MTINLENVELLLERELDKRKNNLSNTNAEIEEFESKLESLRNYADRLSFYIDKFSKVTSIIEMDKKNKKPFEEIHSNMFLPVDEK